MPPRPRVLAVLPHVIPSTVICLIKPLTALHRGGSIHVDWALEYWVSCAQVQRADVVVFCRNIEPAHNDALNAALEFGKPIVYELDDNLFELPAYLKADQHYSSPERQRQLVTYLQAADLVRVHSEYLRQQVAPINSNVVRVNGPLDWSLVPALRPKREPHGKVRIVYATGRTRDELGNIFLPDVERLLGQYGDRVELFLWGYRNPKLVGHASVHFLDHVMSYDRYLSKLAHYRFDIGLAPLLNDSFHLSKSNVKFREYAACRVAGIYSKVSVYSECVEHGVTGLLVENQPDAWFKAIQYLVEDASRRDLIQERAYQYARQHYSQDEFCALWLDHIRSLTNSDDPDRVLSRSARRFLQDRSMKKHGVLSRGLALGGRFWQSLRLAGWRESLIRARWMINDLTILRWKR